MYTFKIISLKFYALKLNNGQRLKKLMYFFANVAYVVSYFALELGVVAPLYSQIWGFCKKQTESVPFNSLFIINHQFVMQFIVKPMQGTL